MHNKSFKTDKKSLFNKLNVAFGILEKKQIPEILFIDYDVFLFFRYFGDRLWCFTAKKINKTISKLNIYLLLLHLFIWHKSIFNLDC